MGWVQRRRPTISADFLPDLLRRPDREIESLSAGLPPEAPEFADIVHRSRAMKRVILRARRIAPRSVPVLIEGETGTGKELLARAIHRTSPRRERPFVAVNCGAISPKIIESELFGHEKGAFTGAAARRVGHFQEANLGTLFLDKVGELPKTAQVKLLRALQESEILPVGSSRAQKVDIRIIGPWRTIGRPSRRPSSASKDRARRSSNRRRRGRCPARPRRDARAGRRRRRPGRCRTCAAFRCCTSPRNTRTACRDQPSSRRPPGQARSPSTSTSRTATTAVTATSLCSRNVAQHDPSARCV